MFDTVLLRHACISDYPDLALFQPKGDRRCVFNPPNENGLARPQLTFYRAPDGIPYLSAMVSIPKALYGNNIQMISEADIPRFLDFVTGYVWDVTGFNFDAWSANVGRLDVCHNWRLGRKAYLYLNSLQNVHLPRMNRRVFENGTVELKNNSEVILVYPKHEETLNLLRQGKANPNDLVAAKGMLRLEGRFPNSRACERLAKGLALPNRTASALLRPSVAEEVLARTMTRLGLMSPIESVNSCFEHLRARYGFSPRGLRLLGFLQACEAYGENVIRQSMTPETFRRNRQALIEAGVWNTNPSVEALAPLTPVRFSEAA